MFFYILPYFFTLVCKNKKTLEIYVIVAAKKQAYKTKISCMLALFPLVKLFKKLRVRGSECA